MESRAGLPTTIGSVGRVSRGVEMSGWPGGERERTRSRAEVLWGMGVIRARLGGADFGEDFVDLWTSVVFGQSPNSQRPIWPQLVTASHHHLVASYFWRSLWPYSFR
jgi:hypothetical protein